MTRIRNWPWRYIARHVVLTITVLTLALPMVVALIICYDVCAVVYAPLVVVPSGGSWADAFDRAIDAVVHVITAPLRLRAWAEAAKPEPRPTGYDLATLQAIASLSYQQTLQRAAQYAQQISRQGNPPGLYRVPQSFQWQPEPPIPDDPNPVLIRGWRSYNVDSDGVLSGATGYRWTAATIAALCHPDGDFGVDAEPHLRSGGCTCGIYVLKERPPDAVVAEVVGWGAYVEYERGWRCQYIRIERLHLPDTAIALRERYGVPVEVETAKGD